VSEWNESAWDRTKREFPSVFVGLGGFFWNLLWAAIAIAASIYFSEGRGLLARIGIGVGALVAGVGVAAISTWLFLWWRALIDQRDEARETLIELTAATPFPNVEIDVMRLQEDWQDHAGNHISRASTYRFWWPVIATNREDVRRVSLSFHVTVKSVEGDDDLFPFLRVEQEDELPLVVEPLDSERIRLSVFLGEYHTERMREERIVDGNTVYEMNGDQLRLNVFDRISQKGIEMQLPGRYPQELAPDP
jgi:hypothetical protein